MTTSIDEHKLHELPGRAIVDFGAVSIAPLVLIGDRLGLYRALASNGPPTPRSYGRAPAPTSATCMSTS